MTTIQEDLNAVAVRVLEDWAMMLVDPAGEWKSIFQSEDDFYVGRLRFKGIVTGTYAVVCQEPFARNLASNLLGGEDDINAGHVRDAISEMTNVLSGNMLTSSYGEDVVFDLTSPSTDVMNFSQVSALMTGFTLSYLGDGEPVAIAFIPEELTHEG